jgi:NADH-quinone oxidoreductase subunit N
VLLQTFALAVLVLAISATLAVFALQAGQLASVRGAQRYLLVSLLAVPLLLLAGWFIDQSLLYAADVEGLAGGSPEMAAALEAAMARRALLPAALGFGFLLAAFPFGTWMPALAADAPPVVAAFIFTAGQAMALYLALALLEAAPALAESQTTLTVMQLAGLVMAASGGLLAAVQRDLGRLFGYAALSDLGILLLAFSSGGSQSLDLVLLHTVNRSAAIVLMAAALAVVRHRAGSDRFADLAGTARRLPVATAGLVLGGLALAGFPFTAGFPTHWAVSRATWSWVQPFSPLAAEVVPAAEAAPGQQWVWVLTMAALLASFVGVVVGLLRGLQAMRRSQERVEMERQPILASFMIVALGALTVVLGLYPQLFLEPVSEAARAISLF